MRRILLLRGVNVGGVKLPMAGFRALLTDLGLAAVQTFIQSGNAVFRSDGDPRDAIARGLKERFSLAPALFLYDPAGFRAILSANPFAEAGRADGARVHLFFTGGPVTAGEIAALQAFAAEGERLAAGEGALYLHAPQGLGRSVLAEKMGRRIKVPMTGRNQRSAEAILALAEAL